MATNANLPKTGTGLSESEAEERFQKLQQKLIPLWSSIHQMTQDEQTIVVVPSLSVDSAMGTIMQAYEERFLFLLLLLRQPQARLIYVTSEAIQHSVIDYYLG